MIDLFSSVSLFAGPQYKQLHLTAALQQDGLRGGRRCRVDWLVLALWMDRVVVENWYHSSRQRERETLGRSWNEKNRCTANRGRGRDRGASPAFDIKCIYTQACFFFFLPAASSFSSPPPLFSVTALKGPMFILKDVRRHELTHTRACDSFEVYERMSREAKSGVKQMRFLCKSNLFEIISSLESNIITVSWADIELINHLLPRSNVEKSSINHRDELWLNY